MVYVTRVHLGGGSDHNCLLSWSSRGKSDFLNYIVPVSLFQVFQFTFDNLPSGLTRSIEISFLVIEDVKFLLIGLLVNGNKKKGIIIVMIQIRIIWER